MSLNTKARGGRGILVTSSVNLLLVDESTKETLSQECPADWRGYCLKGVRTYYGRQRQKEFGGYLNVITGGFKEIAGMCKTADGMVSRRPKGRGRERSRWKKEWAKRRKRAVGKQAAGQYVFLAEPFTWSP